MKTFLLTTLFISLNIHSSTATDFANKVYDSNRPRSLSQKVKMKLINSKQDEKTRIFRQISNESTKLSPSSMIQFEKPSKMKGISLLTKNEAGDNYHQWIYLPATKKIRKISSNKKSGRFVQSDLTFEDFLDRDPSLDNYKILKETKNITILKSTPKDKGTSQYQHIIRQIDKNKLIDRQIDFFKNNKKVKSTKFLNFKKIKGYWIPTLIKVKDLKRSHETILEILDTKVDLDKYKKMKFNKNMIKKKI